MAIDKEHASIILKRVFENGVCSDRITLISGKDNQRIPIHRAILTASSKYFLASLGPNFQESKEDEFILEGTDEGTVKAIVDFCYTGCIDLTENNVKKFLTIASSIELNLLEQKCRQFYLKELSANNAVETLMFAEKYSYADLRQKAFDFICANFDTSDIHKSQHQLLQELVESNKIQSSDESVLKRLLDWFQSEEEERKQYMPKLLKFIRLDRITMQWNSVTTLMLADKYGYADLRQRALDIVCGRFAKLPAAEIQKLDHRLLKELLNCDHIQATEDMVFKRVTEWCRSKEDERSQYMPELLKLIRLEYITPQFLNETVVPVYEKLRISEIVFAEYRRRSSSQCRHMDVQRSRSIFCLYSQHEGENIIKIERYNSILNIYEIVAEISLGNRDCDNAVLHKTVVYLVGGAIGDEFLKTMTSYDLISKEKKVLPVMSIPREDCTSILFGKYIYVFGGYNEVLGIRFCERFDTEINEWKELKSMKFARYNASATILNGYIYVAGGRANPGGVRTSVELYDPKCDDWTDVKPMIKSRDKFALIESNGFLYAMGGGHREIERYDPYKARWTVIGSFDQSHLISDGINMDSQIFVIMMSGEFGRIKIDDNDKFLFVSMGKSRHEFEHFQRHYLIRN